jgi:acyl CoA:acetate/3-ketoacid CoA transferase beta subunit
VVSNLGVFDFEGPDHTFRAISLHPGVTPEQVAENTSFEVAGLTDAGVTREPGDDELHLIREVLDPRSLRDREVSV